MKALPCTRSLAEQAEDRTGARRRGDHELSRLDLLSDDELDAFRARYGSMALDEADVLAEGLTRIAERDREAQRALEGRVGERPILAIVVCMACGTFEVVRSTRPWMIDRAMRQSGLAERDVRRTLALLIEAGGTTLDGLEGEQIRELHALVGNDADLETVRAQFVPRT